VFEPNHLPPDLVQAIEHVRSLPIDDCVEMSAIERAEWISGLEVLINATRAASAEVLTMFDAAGDGHTLHAARSTAAWARGALSISGGEATERIHLARSARTFLAPSMTLLREGALSYEQVRSIERGVRTLPEQHREHAVTVLNEAAKGLDFTHLWLAVRHLHNVVDPDGSAKSAAEKFDRRYLHLPPARWHGGTRRLARRRGGRAARRST